MATKVVHQGCTAPEWCGRWEYGSEQMCDDKEAKMLRQYPQGWRYYPGDVCSHGRYVGGSGVDWMCGACEGGD